MKTIVKLKGLTVWLIILLVSINHAGATDYYIDATSGNDSNDGTSTVTPWQTLDNINTTVFQPGDNILFKSGESWAGAIKPQGSGTAGNPITIGKYGTGANPAIHGDGTINCTLQPGVIKYCTIFLNNQEYWVVQDLEITNYDSTEEGGKSLAQWESDNITNYVNVSQPSQYTGINSKKCAIMVEANNMGAVNYLHFKNLEIHGVNGDISQKNNGGIFFRIFNYGSDVPTYFNDVLVEDCYIHDVDRTGVSNISYYDDRTLTTNTNWTPSLNLVIRNNTFQRTGANALIVRAAESPLIEHNLFDSCSIKGSGNAVFNFNTDNALMQFNEGRYTKYNVGDDDAGGIDSDYRTKNTIIQYNYIHDNDFGPLITGGPGSGTGFNDNTIFRYNILENDGILQAVQDGAWAIKVSGNATNTNIYNNVVFIGDTKSYTDIVYHKSWSGGIPNGTTYSNNIFYNSGTNTQFNLTSSNATSFNNNVFFGNTFISEPSDANKMTSDPLLSNPGGGENGYELQAASPALANGLRLATTPDKDYYQNTILATAAIDIGVYQVTESSTSGTNNNLAVLEDSFVRGGSNADTNYDGELMNVKESPSNASFSRRTWLKFDVSGYSAISNAVLHISGNQTSGTVLSARAYQVTDDSWSEGTITWNNAPAQSTFIGTFPETVIASSGVYSDYALDITSYVQQELAGDKIVSVNIADDVDITNGQFRVWNKEGGGTGNGVAAYLEITGTILGVEDKNAALFRAHPNPINNGRLHINAPSQIEKIEIYSIDGRLVKRIENIGANSFSVDFDSFHMRGIYLLQIEDSSGSKTVKRIIKS